MADPAVGGDLVLAARPVTAEAFAPFGRLLSTGERVRLGGKAATLLALDAREAGPRRVRHLQRLPGARRLLLSVGDAPLLLVVAGKGDMPAGPAAAFVVPGRTGVLVEAGVWHAGPLALADGAVLEAVEVAGAVDHIDRAAVGAAFGADSLRVLLPDEQGAPGPGLDLADEFAVTLAPALRGRVLLGCLSFDRLSVHESGEDLRGEADRVVEDLRRQWEALPNPDDAPALRPVRELYRTLGFDPQRTRPSSEALLRRVLQGRPLYRVNNLVDAVNLCSLRMQVPFGVYDRARIAAPVVLRPGQAGEAMDTVAGGRVGVEGRPVLADRDGAFGSPTADARRTSPGHATARVLVVLYAPPGVPRGAVDRMLSDASEAIRHHCGGAEAGRRVVA